MSRLGGIRALAKVASSFASMASPARLVVVGMAPAFVILLSMFERGGLEAVLRPAVGRLVISGDVLQELDMYGSMLAVAASLAAVLLFHAAFGGGGGVRLAYGYTGSPSAVALGVFLAGLAAGLGFYAPFAVYLMVLMGDAYAVALLALAFAVDVAGSLALVALVGGRVEGSWGIVGLVLVLARALCHIPVGRECAASSVSLAAAAMLGGLGAGYMAAALALFAAAPLAAFRWWGRP